jgi:hypothetical protein
VGSPATSLRSPDRGAWGGGAEGVDGRALLAAAAAVRGVTAAALAQLAADFDVERVRAQLGDHAGWLTRYDSSSYSGGKPSPQSPPVAAAAPSPAALAAAAVAAAGSAASAAAAAALSIGSKPSRTNGLRPPAAAFPAVERDPAAEIADPFHALRADLSRLDATNRTDAASFQRRIEHTEGLLAASAAALASASRWEATCAIEVAAAQQASQRLTLNVQHARARLDAAPAGGSGVAGGSRASHPAGCGAAARANSQRIWHNRVSREMEQLRRRPPEGVELLEDEAVQDSIGGGGGEGEVRARNLSRAAATATGVDAARCTCTVKLRCSYQATTAGPLPSREGGDAASGGAAGQASRSARSVVLLLDLGLASRCAVALSASLSCLVC